MFKLGKYTPLVQALITGKSVEPSKAKEVFDDLSPNFEPRIVADLKKIQGEQLRNGEDHVAINCLEKEGRLVAYFVIIGANGQITRAISKPLGLSELLTYLFFGGMEGKDPEPALESGTKSAQSNLEAEQAKTSDQLDG